MVAEFHDELRIPVICIDPSSVVGAELFNPNSWSDSSKGIIQSCWSEYSVLNYCVDQLTKMCAEPELLCTAHIQQIQEQWRTHRFALKKVNIFGEVSELHLHIEALFSGVKSILDLIMQLLSTEKIVGSTIHGFHRDGGIYGGKVLNSLSNNRVKDKQQIAKNIEKLITDHKVIWIDEVIESRDRLVHPEKGMIQLMFHMCFTEKGDELVCKEIVPPMIDGTTVDEYGRKVLKHVESFSMGFLNTLC